MIGLPHGVGEALSQLYHPVPNLRGKSGSMLLHGLAWLEAMHRNVAQPHAFERLAQPFWGTGKSRESTEMRRDNRLDAKKPSGIGCLTWPHGIEVADGEYRYLGLVERADNAHVTKDIGVSRDVDAQIIAKVDDVARRLAAIEDRVAIQ